MNTTAETTDTTAMRSLMEITARPDVVMIRGEGSWLWDTEGRRYLDFVQGWAVNTLGHCPAVVQEALQQQASELIHPSAAFHNRPQLQLAARLTAHCDLDRVFFCNSGAEANEGAIKLARKWGQRHRGGAATIVTTAGSFHGRTLATMAASGKPGFATRFPPSIDGFVHVPFGDIAAVDTACDAHSVAGVMVEPIQGEAGIVVPPDGYLRALRALCDARGILMIVDEIQTGVGRTGALFCHQHEGITPDIMTLGKGLGGGVPLSALLCTEPTACFEHGDQGGTFNGNPLMTAVGDAVLSAVLEDGFLQRVRDAAARLRDGLVTTAQQHGGSMRGKGLLAALVLTRSDAVAVRDACMARGVLINAPRPDVLRFMPALDVSDGDIDTMLSTLDRALRDVRDQSSDDDAE